MTPDTDTPDLSEEDNTKRYRHCPECGARNAAMNNFCVYCGAAKTRIQRFCTYCGTEIHLQRYCTNCGLLITSSVQPVYPYNSPVPFRYPVSTAQVPFKKPESPSWWKLPAFHAIFGTYALMLPLGILFLLILFFLDVSFLLTYSDSISFQLIFEMSARIFQLVIIAIIIYKFDGYKDFLKLSPRTLQNEGEIDEWGGQQAFHWKEVIKEAIPYIVVFVLALVLLDVVVFLVLELLKSLLEVDVPFSSAYEGYYVSWEATLVFTFMIVIFAPIHEELLFRGYIYQSLVRTGTSEWVQYSFQAIGFALLHLPGDLASGASWDFIIVHLIVTGGFGLFATYLRKKFDTVVVPMIFHGCFNLFPTILDLMLILLPQINDLIEVDIILIVVSLITCIYLLNRLKSAGKWKPRFFWRQESFSLNRQDLGFFTAITGLMIIIIFAEIFFSASAEKFAILFLAVPFLILTAFFLWGMIVVDRKWNEFFR
ncbi:MAG: type II CAAX prenyl endopeptidase Rce1 family protein [Candidatus Odinarchaeota archaeon]